jgi:hypothetical protein
MVEELEFCIKQKISYVKTVKKGEGDGPSLQALSKLILGNSESKSFDSLIKVSDCIELMLDDLYLKDKNSIMEFLVKF